MEGLDPRVINSIVAKDDDISPTEEALREEIKAQEEVDADKVKTDSITSKSVGDIQRKAVLEEDVES